MPQTLRPSTDLLDGSWIGSDGDAIDNFLLVSSDDATDSDFCECALTPDSDIAAWELASGEDPLVNTGHIMRIRLQKNDVGGALVEFIGELRQGYLSEAAQGTLIATAVNDTDVDNIFTTVVYTLTAGEADAITNYADLDVRVRSNQTL